MGIISLSVFVVLIVLSYSLFGVFSIAYIVGGIIVYGFLMESLLRKPNKISILGYVTFEVRKNRGYNLNKLFYTNGK